MMNKTFQNISAMLVLALTISFYGCEDEENFPTTRLFKPVVRQDLLSEANTIIVNMGDSKRAINYSIEVSRDTFQTTDYRFEMDTHYFVIDSALVGEPLFWNTRYQVRAKAHAEDSQYDSRWSDLGGVRTQRFPSNLLAPEPNDVIDVAAKVEWARVAKPITKIGVFAATDLRLARPLSFQTVTEAEELKGEKIVTGLQQLTPYQIAIYDEDGIRGWQNYTTSASKIDKNDPNVIDLTTNTDPDAVINAYLAASDGQVILLKKGVTYNLPQSGDHDANKSITIMGDLGFEEQKSKLFTTGNWNLLEGANIDHIRFVDLEIEGEDMGGDYVFNPNRSAETRLRELTFEDCEIHNLRGILRVRSSVFVEDYSIRNSIVHHIGGYGLVTCDTDGEGAAAVDNIVFENSTFSHIIIGIQTRQNTQSVLIESCTFNNFPETGRQIFRYRGAEGFDNSISGITINNSIFGHAWDQSGAGLYEIKAVDGLTNTNIASVNNYATSGYTVRAGHEITGMPNTVYGGTAEQLWVEPDSINYNFMDTGFAGRLDSGDPRWRLQ